MFMINDRVSYIGDKFHSELGSKMGEICAPVQNQQGVFVVNFGKEDYVMSSKFLKPFQGHIKNEEEKGQKETRVERRHFSLNDDTE
jgi:hypothetical protein